MLKSLGLRLTLLIVLVLILSALLAPPVFLLLQYLIEDLKWPYSRVYDRVLLVVAVALVYLMRQWFFVKGQGIKINFKSFSVYLSFLSGVLLSLVPVLIILPWVADGVILSAKDLSFADLFPKVLKLIPTMLLVGVIEELVFRYFIFMQFRKNMSFWGAALSSSLIYAIVHFVTPVKTFTITHYSISSGFNYYLEVFSQLANFDLFIQLGIIFLIGVLLCYVLEKSGTISLCIGLHAGWIAGIKLAKFTTDLLVPLPPAAVRYALLESSLAWVAVLISFVAVILIVRRFKQLPREVASVA